MKASFIRQCCVLHQVTGIIHAVYIPAHVIGPIVKTSSLLTNADLLAGQDCKKDLYLEGCLSPEGCTLK